MAGGHLSQPLAPEDALGKELPLEILPPLLAPGRTYHLQTCLGLCIGGSAMCLYNGAVAFIAAFAAPGSDLAFWGPNCLTPLTRSASVISVSCTVWVLFGRAGVIQRTQSTCYPMPAEVKRRLLEGESLSDMKNVEARDDDTELDSFCVRCLVWRRRAEESAPRPHHCSICQRCVEGFDHHCNLLGRCIVRRNMVCFYAAVALMMLGMVDVLLAACAALPQGSLLSLVLYVLLCSLVVLYVCLAACLVACTVVFGKS